MLRGYLILKAQKIMFFKSIILLNIDLTKKMSSSYVFKNLQLIASQTPNTWKLQKRKSGQANNDCSLGSGPCTTISMTHSGSWWDPVTWPLGCIYGVDSIQLLSCHFFILAYFQFCRRQIMCYYISASSLTLQMLFRFLSLCRKW